MIEASLFAAIAPFVLVFVESVIPIASLVEEVTKAIILWLNPHKLLKTRLIQALIVGTLFTISETVLYSTTLYNLNGQQQASERLVYTIFLHTGTCLLLSLPNKHQKYLRILVLIMSIGIHFIYNNYLISSF